MGPVGAAAGLVGTGIKVAGSLAQGSYNNKVAQRNALMEQRDAAAQAGRIRDDVRRHIGGQITAQGASGFQTGTGSALDAIMESQVEGMLDVLTVRQKGASAADAYRAQGRLAKMQGQYGAAGALAEGAARFASGGGFG